MTAFQMVHLFRCPECGESTVLPRRSPLGTVVDQEYQPNPVWPILVLCTRRVRVCECLVDRIDLDAYPRKAPIEPLICLWEIEAKCAHKNCGLPKYIYAKYRPDKTAQDVIGRLLKAKPRIPCVHDHDALWTAAGMTVTELLY